jgi:hypothetical protein
MQFEEVGFTGENVGPKNKGCKKNGKKVQHS